MSNPPAPATFIMMIEDADGSPAGITSLCGPCAASAVYHLGASVTGRPLSTPDGARFTWPAVEAGHNLDVR